MFTAISTWCSSLSSSVYFTQVTVTATATAATASRYPTLVSIRNTNCSTTSIRMHSTKAVTKITVIPRRLFIRLFSSCLRYS